MSFGVGLGINPNPQRKSKWGPMEKTIMPNVSHIIPSYIEGDQLHSFLLRFQMEEVQYKLNHIEEELKYVNPNSQTMITLGNDLRNQIPAEVKARDALVQERRQIVESIERVFPAYRPPISVRYNSNKAVKRIELNSKLVGLIIGMQGSNIMKLERDFKVRLSFRKNNESNGDSDSSSTTIFIIGTSESDVDRCYKKLEQMISNENTNFAAENANEIDFKEYSLSFDPNEEIIPWKETTTQSNNNYEANVKDLLLNIELSDAEDESDYRKEIEKHYSMDLYLHDLSSVIKEPLPPGL